jgi:hypothetical protein
MRSQVADFFRKNGTDFSMQTILYFSVKPTANAWRGCFRRGFERPGCQRDLQPAVYVRIVASDAAGYGALAPFRVNSGLMPIDIWNFDIF